MSAAAGVDPRTARLYRRLLRRETHRSRSVAAVLVAVVVLLGAGYVGAEIVAAAVGAGPLLVEPTAAVAAAAEQLAAGAPLAIAVSAALVVVGVVLVVLALAPGRRGRHVVQDERLAVVADDRVVASAAARAARAEAGLSLGQARAAIGRRRVEVTLTPSSGFGIDRDAVAARVDEELARARVRPAVSATVRVTENGRVGA